MTSPFDNVKLHAIMQRQALDGFLAGFAQARGTVAQALRLDPAHLTQGVLELARIGYNTLPLGTLDPAQKLIYSRRDYPGVRTFVCETAGALRILSATDHAPFKV